MIEATSCGGVVIFRGKILLLYKNVKHKYEGWVLPKGTVKEEASALCRIVDYVDRSHYTFEVPEGTVSKDVHWFLMQSDSFYSKPQREEYFQDSGYYKYHEAYHLLKFANERKILEQAYAKYQLLRKNQMWGRPRR